LEALFKHLEINFPQAFLEIKNKVTINENLFSPFTLKLPTQVFKDVEKFVHLIYKIKEQSDYHNLLPNNYNLWPQTPSLLTCFDFHYSSEMGLKLIEINTNAALYLTSLLQLQAYYNRPMEKQWVNLLDMFKKSFELHSNEQISILDENPESEGLYFEFLVFKDWLTKQGFKTNIVSIKEYQDLANKNVYNRYNDFYLTQEKSQAILKDYINLDRKISPNPREYFLLADKKRLASLKQILENIDFKMAEIIPESRLFSDFNDIEDLWSQRKKYFLKPSQSFGSKGVYSGKGISRKAFDAIYDPNFMAQEICPAGKQKFTLDSHESEFKFDLRFFTFDGKILHSLARLYQGQATNMRTKNGGIAPLDFED
jgi:hypothetical protein